MTDAVAAGIIGAAAWEVARRRALEEAARGYAAASKAPNTVRAYRCDLRDFSDWCAARRVTALPAAPSTVDLYITALAEAGARASTIQRRLAAISKAHQLAAHVPSPTADVMVRTTMAGIRRSLGTAPQQKTPVITGELCRLLAATPADTRAGRRDRALLLVGFAAGLRRSELCALDAEDATESGDGLRLRLRRSKTDLEAAGAEVGIPLGQHPETCPIRALRAWRAAAGITTGPLFRAVSRHDHVAPDRLTDGSVARIVQRAARRAGLDPALYAGHSLRSGLAMAAAAGGASERAIMRQGRWTSATTARRYIRAGTLFDENAAAFCGL